MARTSKKPEINARIRHLRKDILHVTQEEYANYLGITQGAYSDMENLRSTPTERMIRDICLRDHVNKEWLTEGTEPIFSPMNRQEEIASFMGEVLRLDQDGGFKQDLIYILSKLNESQWEALAQIYGVMIQEYQNKKKG